MIWLCIVTRQFSFILLEERTGKFLWWLTVHILTAWYQHYRNEIKNCHYFKPTCILECSFYNRISQFQHCWHFRADNSYCGGRFVPGGIYSSIPGLYPLDASSTLLQSWQPKMSPRPAGVPWWVESPRLRTTSLFVFWFGGSPSTFHLLV